VTNSPITKPKSIKCLVWDLDNTIWEGILLEDAHVQLKPYVSEVIRMLDSRGIVNSIASKNEYQPAWNKLKEFDLDRYFIYPQINWNSKAESIRYIAKKINIGIDTIAFVDDQEYERDEVKFSLPEVLCLDTHEIHRVPDMEAFTPQFVTSDSALRRQMYLSDAQRNEDEEKYQGPKEDFLKSLNMELSIFDAGEDDLQRAAELTVRTNQLNATGYTYSYDELKSFIYDENFHLIMTRLTDRYGTYGHIGLALIEKQAGLWIIKLLLMSCRVISRGIGAVILAYIMNEAQKRNVILQAEFVPTDRNRLMNISYRLAGFNDVKVYDELIVLQNDLSEERHIPDYMKVTIDSNL
jgi:FkbH-like protein